MADGDWRKHSLTNSNRWNQLEIYTGRRSTCVFLSIFYCMNDDLCPVWRLLVVQKWPPVIWFQCFPFENRSQSQYFRLPEWSWNSDFLICICVFVSVRQKNPILWMWGQSNPTNFIAPFCPISGRWKSFEKIFIYNFQNSEEGGSTQFWRVQKIYSKFYLKLSLMQLIIWQGYYNMTFICDWSYALAPWQMSSSVL